MTKRYCFALDLKDEPRLIAAYKKHHKHVWPEVIASLKESGIEQLDIYLVGNRLFMVMAVSDDFCFEARQVADLNNDKVVEWETLMSTFQQQLPWATGNEKWLLMDNIFTF